MSEISIGLAPMHGVTTFPARIWFSLASPFDFCSTPFLRVTRGFPAKRISPLFIPEIFELKSLTPYRATPQIMASSPQDFVDIAKYFLQYTEEVELNCGCPSPTVFGNGAGSSLLAETEKFRRFVEAIVGEIGPEKLSVKMRTGVEDPSRFSQLTSSLKDIACKRVVVHGRTRKDGYTGLADWNLINFASDELPFPVRGSGDINSWQQFASQHQGWKCESVIVGRGALRNPWIFSEIKASKSLDLSHQTLYWSLAVWLLLHDSVTRAVDTGCPEAFIDMAAEAMEAGCCGADVEKWQTLYEKLSVRANGICQSLLTVEASPQAMGHLKMFWNYLRSGLPQEYFMLPVLRARTPAVFFGVLGEKAKVSTSFSVRHQSQHDWIYAGRGRPN